MLLLDSFDSDVEADYLKHILTKNNIVYKEEKGSGSYSLFINEADMDKVTEIIKTLD